MKKYLFIFVFLFGCVSDGVVLKDSIKTTVPTNSAMLNFLVIKQLGEGDINYLLVPTQPAVIKINGKKIAAIKKREITQTTIKPGKHKITTYWSGEGWNKKNVSLEFEEGKIYYFGIGVGEKTGITYGNHAGIKKLTKAEWDRYSSR